MFVYRVTDIYLFKLKGLRVSKLRCKTPDKKNAFELEDFRWNQDLFTMLKKCIFPPCYFYEYFCINDLQIIWINSNYITTRYIISTLRTEVITKFAADS